MAPAIGLLVITLICGGRLAHAGEAQDSSSPEQVAKNKATILERLRRDKPTYRGTKPGETRFRWEWYNRTVGNYLYEKNAMLTVEAYRLNTPHDLRPGFMYRDMRVTFQEIFGLGPEEDEKLIPILSHRTFLELIPNASLVGLTLRGKQGEVKGVITRKYKMASLYGGLMDNVEYKASNGKTVRAFGMAYDAFTIAWKDIKDRVADEVSQAKAIEDLEMIRDLLYPDETEEKDSKSK